MNTINEYRWFSIEPVDAWFFRDGRPSNRDEDQSDLESQFPPNPGTVVGAFRSALARARGWNGRGSWDDRLKLVLGDGPDDLGKLSFLGPFIAREGQPLFPIPAHLLGKESYKDGRRAFTPAGNWLAPSQNAVMSDLGAVPLPVPSRPLDRNQRLRSPENFLIHTSGLQKILEGTPPADEECIPLEDLFKHEPRIGILRDERTRTTGENAMYSPRFIRLAKRVSLLAGITGLPDDWAPPGVFPLGGESRLALCTELDTAPPWPQSPPIEHGRAILALLTPACWPAEKWWGAGPGEAARLLHPQFTGTVATAAFDRPRLIGGWDSIRGAPLSLGPCAAPGSVWWLVDAGAIQQPVPLLGGKTQYGFGLAVLGRCPSQFGS